MGKRLAFLFLMTAALISVFSCASSVESERLVQEWLEQVAKEEQERLTWLHERTETVRKEEQEKAEQEMREEERRAEYVEEFKKSNYVRSRQYRYWDYYYYENKPGLFDNEEEIIKIYSVSDNPYGYEEGQRCFMDLTGGNVLQWLGKKSVLFNLGHLAYLHWDDASLAKSFGSSSSDRLFFYEGVYEYKTAGGSMKIVPKFRMVRVDYKTEEEVKKLALEDYERKNPGRRPSVERAVFPQRLLDGFVYVGGNSEIKGFYMDSTEVTQALYESVMGVNPSEFKGPANPVECVSWHDTVKFCNMLSIACGLEECYAISGNDVACDFDKNGYRLPTEAEWMCAARGGNRSRGCEYSGSNNINTVA